MSNGETVCQHGVRGFECELCYPRNKPLRVNTPPETPLAKAAIPRLPIINAELALRTDRIYNEAVSLAMVCKDEDAKSALGRATEALAEAVRVLLTVRR